MSSTDFCKLIVFAGKFRFNFGKVKRIYSIMKKAQTRFIAPFKPIYRMYGIITINVIPWLAVEPIDSMVIAKLADSICLGSLQVSLK